LVCAGRAKPGRHTPNTLSARGEDVVAPAEERTRPPPRYDRVLSVNEKRLFLS